MRVALGIALLSLLPVLYFGSYRLLRTYQQPIVYAMHASGVLVAYRSNEYAEAYKCGGNYAQAFYKPAYLLDQKICEFRDLWLDN